MRLDNLDSLKNPEGFYDCIKAVADKFINSHPALAQRAQAVAVAQLNNRVLDEEELSHLASLEEVEKFLEKEFIKREKISYILSTDAGKAVVEASKQFKGVEKILPQAWAYLKLHLRVSPSQFIGWLDNKFEEADDLLDFIEQFSGKAWDIDPRTGWFVTKQGLSEDESFDLDLFQSSLPMVVPPRKVSATNSSAYLLRRVSLWSRKATIKHKNVPYEAMNLQNQVRYTINYGVWEKFKFEIELPQREPGEADPHYSNRCKSVVREHWRKAFVIALFQKLGIHHIWIPGQWDHRLRKYDSQGGVFNTQGQDADKALFSLDPEILTESGKKWLAISIANCFNVKYKEKDLDKLLFEERLEWYENTIQPLMSLSKEEFNQKLDELLKEAESPACAWAQTQNMYEAEQRIKEGLEPMVWSITHWDATSSGYQFQSLYAKDLKTAEGVNMSPENKRFDLYTDLYNEVKAKGCSLDWTRKQLKSLIWLPSSYGASAWKQKLADMGHKKDADLIEEVLSSREMWGVNRFMSNLDPFIGENYSMYLPDGAQVTKKFDHQTVITVPLLGKQVNIMIKTDGRGIDPRTGKRKWSTEYLTVVVHSNDGWVLRELVYRSNLTPKLIKSIKWSFEHPDTEEVGPNRDIFEMYKMLKYMLKFQLASHRLLRIITPSNVHLLNDGMKGLVMELIKESSPKNYDISCIHDSFGVLPNYTEDLMNNYRHVMADIARSRWLNACVEQLTEGKKSLKEIPCTRKFNNNILNSKYMLC